MRHTNASFSLIITVLRWNSCLMDTMKSSTTSSLYPFGCGKDLNTSISGATYYSNLEWKRYVLNMNECKGFFPPSPTCPVETSCSQFVLELWIISRPPVIKVALSPLAKKSSCCVPTARWIPRKKGEKSRSRGRNKVGRYIYHAVVVPQPKYWSHI